MPNKRNKVCKAAGSVSKPSGGCYHVLRQALSQFQQQRRAVQQAQYALVKGQERQFCLMDLVIHQELCLSLLQNHYPRVLYGDQDQAQSALSRNGWTTEGNALPVTASSENVNANRGAGVQRIHQPASDTGTRLHNSGFVGSVVNQPAMLQEPGLETEQEFLVASGAATSPTAACSYVAELLQSATVNDIHRILSLSPTDWLDYWNQCFLKMVVHLELADREPADNSQPHGNVRGDSSTASVDLLPASTEHADLLPRSPVDSLQQLYNFVDIAARDVVLAYCFNHVPLLEACMCSCVLRTPQTPPAGHWESVAKRLQLTDAQMLHYVIAYEEYARLQASAAQQGTELLSSSNRLTSLLQAVHFHQSVDIQQAKITHNAAAVVKHPQQQQQQQQQCGQDSSSNTEEDIQAQLQRLTRSRHIQLRMIAFFLLNTLSRFQLVQLVIGSFPYVPSLTAIAKVVAAEHYQKQQQQQVGDENDVTDEEAVLQGSTPKQQQLEQLYWVHSDALRADIEQDIKQHVARRREMLQQQHASWWQQQQLQLQQLLHEGLSETSL